MSGPHLLGRMTNVIDVKRGEKVLEIGTGSGYSRPISPTSPTRSRRSRSSSRSPSARAALYDKLIDKGYTEYKHIKTKNADGYYGWEEAAPVRQDHRDLRHRPRAAAAAAAAQDRRHDGDPGRPAGRAARAQGDQDAGRRRLHHDAAARTSTAARSCRSCPSPSSKATRSSARTTAERDADDAGNGVIPSVANL